MIKWLKKIFESTPPFPGEIPLRPTPNPLVNKILTGEISAVDLPDEELLKLCNFDDYPLQKPPPLKVQNLAENALEARRLHRLKEKRSEKLKNDKS